MGEKHPVVTPLHFPLRGEGVVPVRAEKMSIQHPGGWASTLQKQVLKSNAFKCLYSNAGV